MTREYAKLFAKLLNAYAEGKVIEMTFGNDKWYALGEADIDLMLTDYPWNYRIQESV